MKRFGLVIMSFGAVLFVVWLVAFGILADNSDNFTGIYAGLGMFVAGALIYGISPRPSQRRRRQDRTIGEGRSDESVQRHEMKCRNCGSYVRPRRRVNGVVMFVLFFAGILPALFYYLGAGKRCPRCGARL